VSAGRDVPSGEVAPSRAESDGSESPPERAASPGVPSEDIEEILVRGQAGQGISIDSADAVTSFGAEELAALGVQDVSDVAKYTPNLEIRTAGATTATFFIRGVGLNDFTANASGAVAIYRDGVALNLPALQLGQLFDLETLDVLRGPQGSGPGRNATGGAILSYSRKPTGDYGANVRADYGRFGFLDVEGAVEAPIIEDVLSTRLAFRLTQRDPIVENGCGGAPPIGPERITVPGSLFQPSICGEANRYALLQNPSPPPNILYRISDIPAGLPDKMNDLDTWAARAQLRFLPPESDFEFLLNVHGGRVDQLARVGEVIGTAGSIQTTPRTRGFFGGTSDGYRQPEIRAEEDRLYAALGGPEASNREERTAIRTRARLILGDNLAKRLDTEPYRGDYNLAGPEKQDSWGGFIRADWEGEFFQVVSISAFDRYERSRLTDADYTPQVIFENETDDDAWQFTQDLAITGELTDHALQWNTGAYFLMEELDYQQIARTEGGSGLRPLTRAYEQDTWSLGVYAGFNWEFLDDFELLAGVRYNIEHKEYTGNLNRGNEPLGAICFERVTPNGTVLPAQDCLDSGTWSAPTGSVSLTYDFETVLVYAKFNRGWKGPQYNSGGGSGAAFTVAEPETVDAFEFGLKGTWLDDRITLTAAVFHYNYSNYQVFLSQNDAITPPSRIVVNARDAELYGAEIETTVEPVERLVVTARVGWIEGEFQDFTQSVIRNIPGQDLFDPPKLIPVEENFTGNRLPNTPRWKISGIAEYTWDFGRWGSLIPHYDFVWTDDNFFDQTEGLGNRNADDKLFMPEYAIGQRAYWLHNVRLGYRSPDGRTEVALWMRNVTDEVYKTLAFNAAVAASLVGNLVGDPRTYGVSLSLRW